MSHFSEPSSLVVVETQALPSEPGLQQSILFTQERDDIGLLTLEPSAQHGDQQLKLEHGRSLRQCRRSIGGTLRARGVVFAATVEESCAALDTEHRAVHMACTGPAGIRNHFEHQVILGQHIGDEVM